jgi:outer membrane protein assembly factor BamA
MTARSKLEWLCRTPTSMAFAALFAIGQCMAQNPVGAPAQSDPEAQKKTEFLAAFNRQQSSSIFADTESSWQPDTNAPGAPSPQTKKAGSMMDRVKDRGRKFPARDYRTAIEIVKHVNGIFGGLEQGAGPGFGIELTTADSVPGIEFSATMLTSNSLYRRFEGEAYIPKIGDEKTHAEMWYGYLRRTEDKFFGIGAFTPLSAKTNFDVERRSVSGGLYRDLNENLQAGIYVSYINSDAYGGQSSKSPSIDTVFSNSPSGVPTTRWLPGLHSGSKVIAYGLFGEYDRRNYENGLTRGFYLYGRFGSVDGLDMGHGIFSDYGWLDAQVDARGYIPLYSNKTSLAVRASTTIRDPKGGSQIPFYDLSFLGGFSHVRGFNTYRFRGNNALIGAVELRQTVYSFKKEGRGLDLIGFGDAGQVWGDNRSSTDPTILGNNNFASRNWKAGIGGGIQYRHTKSLVARFDVATGQDGQRTYFSIARGF